MEHYILLLENGQFATFEQVSNDEVEVIPVPHKYAHPFPTLEEAREDAKGINKGKVRGFTFYTESKVVSIMKVYGIE